MQQKISTRHFNMGSIALELLTSNVYCAEKEKFMKADTNSLQIVASLATALVSLAHDIDKLFKVHKEKKFGYVSNIAFSDLQLYSLLPSRSKCLIELKNNVVEFVARGGAKSGPLIAPGS